MSAPQGPEVRIGALFKPNQPIRLLPDTARQVERLGFDELWVAEDCFLNGGLTAAAAALAVTRRLSIGVGLLPAAVRNVAIAAMELATLAELYPRRVQAAFGHGVEEWMRRIGARPADRIKALREVVLATRLLLHGETVTADGAHVTLRRVSLERPPSNPPPILIGTTGTQGIHLADEVADGLLLPEGAGPAAVSSATSSLGRGAQITVYTWFRVDSDAERAQNALEPVVRTWRERGLFPNLIARGGVPAAAEFDGFELSRVAIVGTPSDCASQLERLIASGASSIVIVPVGEGPDKQLEALATEVLPLRPRKQRRATSKEC
jgi:5,10-methylenetetrahydromethanopterin reductase